MARPTLRAHRRRALLAACSALALAAPGLAAAESPAAIPAPEQQGVRTAFERFASGWMEKVRRMESEQRRSPTVRPGPDAPVVTYRGYGDDFTIELRPTGHASAPYVGILRYSEHLYSCTSVDATNCSIASTVPVTEIFRYEGGRWVY